MSQMNHNMMMKTGVSQQEQGQDRDRKASYDHNEECDKLSQSISEKLSLAAQIPSTSQHPHLFHLATSAPSSFDGGSLAGANEENFKILTGQQASVYIARLEPNAVREPHWHPFAGEVNFVVSGRTRWSFVGPRGSATQSPADMFEASAGDLVFVPPGHFHYFENSSETEDLVVLIVFNRSVSEPNDDIGIVASLSAIPPDVLAACFKTSAEAFKNLPHSLEPVVITRKGPPPTQRQQ